MINRVKHEHHRAAEVRIFVEELVQLLLLHRDVFLQPFILFTLGIDRNLRHEDLPREVDETLHFLLRLVAIHEVVKSLWLPNLELEGIL